MSLSERLSLQRQQTYYSVVLQFSGGNMIEIKEIVTHHKPSIDEWVAIWLLFQFSWAEPGVKLTFDTTQKAGDERTERANLRNGKIFLGTGGGMFDEHPTENRDRIENECCATLLAKFMKVDRDPKLKFVLQLALNDDLGVYPQDPAGKVISKFALPTCIKMMYQNDVFEIESIKDFVFMVLNEHYESQDKFGRNRRVCEAGERVTLSYKEKSFPMLIVHSENEKVHDWAFAKMHYHLVLQIWENGNWQIFSRNGSPIQKAMPLIAGVIKKVEAQTLGIEFKISDLTKDGALPGMPHVYFFEKGGMLFNGNLTHPQEPTKTNPNNFPKLIQCVLRQIKNQSSEETNEQAATSA